MVPAGQHGSEARREVAARVCRRDEKGTAPKPQRGRPPVPRRAACKFRTGSNRRHGTAVPPRANVGRMAFDDVQAANAGSLLASVLQVASLDLVPRQKRRLKRLHND